MFASFLVGYHHHKLGDLATRHPFVQLRHDLLNIRFYLVVGGHYHVEYEYELRSTGEVVWR